MNVIQECRQLIANGHRQEALNALLVQPETPEVLFLLALCHNTDQHIHWKRAIDALGPTPSQDLLLALGQAITQSRKDLAFTQQCTYLRQAIDVSKSLEQHIQQIHWISVLANRLLRLGNTDQALPWLQQSVQLSIQYQHHLATIGQGLILSGIWFSRGEIDRVSALSLSIEHAATQRHNWLAFATARNTRASCLLIRGQHKEALSLLLEGGDQLSSKGAVAALNIIKARLGELHLLLGQERITELIAANQTGSAS